MASSSSIGLSDGRAVAAKTGTTQSIKYTGQNKDAWTVGYTPSLSTAVWIGTDVSDAIKDASGRPIFGRMVPGSIWKEYMSNALRGTPTEPFSAFTPIGTAPSVSDNDDEDSDSSDSDSSDSSDKDKKDKDKDKKDKDKSDSNSDSNSSGDSDSGG